MLSKIPSIMMWDDHDIIDGWGSHKELNDCCAYREIFKSAKKHFELLQVRGRGNNSLIDNSFPLENYSMIVKFRNYNILALDNRTNRSLDKIMSERQWIQTVEILKKCTEGDLLVMVAIPVVYRDFEMVEMTYDATPWVEELTDDIKDHWRAKAHQGERQKLIMNLLDNAKIRQQKTIILSGDVHIGCMGIIQDQREDKSISIHQIVSSGIVHPAPKFIEWAGIVALTNDSTEYLDESKRISTSMLKPFASSQYIRARNFVSLLEGIDNKLWVNWIIEGKDKPLYPLANGS